MLDDYITWYLVPRWLHLAGCVASSRLHPRMISLLRRDSAIPYWNPRRKNVRQRIISILDSSNIHNSNKCVQTAASNDWICRKYLFELHIYYYLCNQLEKLEAAKAAWLVWPSLLSITGSFLVLLGPSGSFLVLLGLSGSFWVKFYWPYRALLSFTGSYWALMGLTEPYWALLSLTGPY